MITLSGFHCSGPLPTSPCPRKIFHSTGKKSLRTPIFLIGSIFTWRFGNDVLRLSMKGQRRSIWLKLIHNVCNLLKKILLLAQLNLTLITVNVLYFYTCYIFFSVFRQFLVMFSIYCLKAFVIFFSSKISTFRILVTNNNM